MDDGQIIELYFRRSEDAIRETDRAYGPRLTTLSHRIVETYEDAQECVSDTYLAAWNTIPPQRPSYFFAYLAKICRNFAFGILDKRRAAKRSADIVTLTAEMELCIPDRRREDRMEAEEIGRLLNAFLSTLSRENRLIFLRRYWFADPIDAIAARYGMGQSKVKTSLHRTRAKLRAYLEQEGITV